MITIFAFVASVFTVAESTVCPDAGTAAGPCFEGECNDGYTCSDGGFCCPTVAKAVQDDLSDELPWPFPNPFGRVTRIFTYRIPAVTRIIAPMCNDVALNCIMFTAYCAPGTQYSWCMQTHCGRTCGYCSQGSWSSY